MEDDEVVIADLLRTLFKLGLFKDEQLLERIIDDLTIKLLNRTFLD